MRSKDTFLYMAAESPGKGIHVHVQLPQMKCGVLTWVCADRPTAPTASVTAKAVHTCKTG